MIIISKEAQDQLQQLKERFGTFKTPKESGRSAFWYWFDQIHNEMQNLERKNLLNGQLLDTRMKWWGNIIYSKSTVNGETTITVEGFEFDFDKFINWLLHKEKHALPFSICDVCFGVACVLYDKSQKYGLVDSLLQPLVKQKFDDIINFHHSTEDYNKIHAIGFLGDRVYSISQKGDITLLHISKQDYLNKKHRYDESNKRYVGILDYITEQKYNTIYKMKSLTQYINESNNKTGKPDKDGKYHFSIHADITLNMDKRGNCDIAVEAQDFEEAKEEAIEIANERLERFPMEWGDVNTATILWDATNNGKIDWGSEQIIG